MKFRIHLFTIFFVSTLVFFVSFYSFAQEEAGEQASATAVRTDEDLFKPETIKNRIGELDAAMAAVEKLVEKTKAENPQGEIQGDIQGQTQSDVEGLQNLYMLNAKIKSAYQTLVSVREKNGQLVKDEKAVRDSLNASPKEILPNPPPYSLSFYDELLSGLDIVRKKKQAAEFALRTSKLALEDVGTNLKKTRGRFEDLAGQKENAGANDGIGPESPLKIAELELELARINHRISELGLDNHTRERNLSDLNSELLKKKIESVRQGLVFNEEDLQKRLQKIEERKQKLEQERAKLLEEQKDIEKKWHEARTNLLQNVRKDREEALKAESLAREAWLNTYHVAVEQIGARIQLLEREKDVAQKRYDLLAGKAGRADLLLWEEDIDENVAELSSLLSLQQNYQATLRSQIALVEKQLEEQPAGSKLTKHLESRIKANERLADRYAEFVNGILNAVNLDQKFSSEIVTRLGQVGISGKLWAFMAESRIVGAIIIITGAILLAIIVAFFINRVLSEVVKRTNYNLDDHVLGMIKKPVLLTILLAGASASIKWAQPRPPFEFIILAVLKTCMILLWSLTIVGIIKGVSQNVIQSWQKSRRQGTEMIRLVDNLARLVVMIGGVFLFLSTWDINVTPLLASAGIAGVAVALAAKETLANLFGGISLMLDQPFKTGDYIVLDSGERGEVREIGMRSTRVWTRDDVLISIPNSVITNSKIVNESAPLPSFRVRVKIGVAYGSDIRLVEKVLLEVADKNRNVVRSPEPRVRFRAFGDSSLDFELLCWGHSPEQKGLLIHELNCDVYEAFNREKIAIPFPQRDVHVYNVGGGKSIEE